MTAEERLAYFQGEKRRSKVHETGKSEKKIDIILFKIKFFIAVIFFVAFLTLDYTGYEIYEIGSECIVREVCADIDWREVLNKLSHKIDESTLY